MRIGTLAAGLALAFAPMAMADDAVSSRAIGFICSAEQDAPAPSSQRRLVMVPGVGTGGFAVVTTQPEAQSWFDYGMKLAHAFYHEDAKAAFKKAMQIDPHCAMCAWGEAWSLGPTINYDVNPAEIQAAKIVADQASALGGLESEKNKALIAALELRYASNHAAADLGFAKAMDALAARYPTDDEIAVMTSDAWLIQWRNHQDREGVARAVTVLQPVLERHPDNTAAIHFYIHATEINGDPALALSYADRLGALAPGASHLVHMASHTFFRVGRYEDAAVANAKAIASDAAYLRAQQDPSPQGKIRYHGHNLIFGLGGALASGDGPLAIRLARHASYAFPPAIAADPYAQAIEGHAYAVYGRYDPDAALKLPDPGAAAPIAQALRHYARGEALIAKHDVAGAKAEASASALTEAQLAALPQGGRETARAVTRIAQLTLQGRVAMLDGDPRSAASAYRAAAEIQETKLTGEYFQDPPPWWFPERRSVAAALLAGGKPAEAVAQARAALKAWPRDPLSLQVLGEAEKADGQSASARRDLARARRTWRGGPVTLARL